MVKAKAATSESVEFEEPIRVLLHQIENLMHAPQTGKQKKTIAELRDRLESVRSEVYANLTAWQRVLVARHPDRPKARCRHRSGRSRGEVFRDPAR